jgi:hypothetical protein
VVRHRRAKTSEGQPPALSEPVPALTVEALSTYTDQQRVQYAWATAAAATDAAAAAEAAAAEAAASAAGATAAARHAAAIAQQVAASMERGVLSGRALVEAEQTLAAAAAAAAATEADAVRQAARAASAAAASTVMRIEADTAAAALSLDTAVTDVPAGNASPTLFSSLWSLSCCSFECF